MAINPDLAEEIKKDWRCYHCELGFDNPADMVRYIDRGVEIARSHRNGCEHGTKSKLYDILSYRVREENLVEA